MNLPPNPSRPPDPYSNRQFYGTISYAAAGAPPPPSKPVVTPIRIAIVVLLMVPVVFVGFLHGWFRRGRDLRTTALVEVAPLRLAPDAQPLAGPPGVDADGYPTQYVDPTILRAMLARQRYADLTTYIEHFEDDFEADPKKEYWIHDVADAFSSGEMSLETQLDAWVAASPTSFAPYLARGAHRAEIAFNQRGFAFIGQTKKSDLKAMQRTLGFASDDLARALSIRPKLVAAKREQLKIDLLLGDRHDASRVVGEALAACPTCFLVRASYLTNLSPRWGGSYAQMTALAAAAPVNDNSRLRYLVGYVDLERSRDLRDQDDLTGALAAADAACAAGPVSDFFRQREVVRADRKDLAGAKSDIDKALALRPMRATFLADRAYLSLKAKDYEAAANDLLISLRIDPTNDRARSNYEIVVDGLAWTADEAHKRGDDTEALRLLDLGADLAPASDQVQYQRMKVLTGSKDAVAQGTAAAQTVLVGGPVPDDINEVRRMDYALSDAKRFEDILKIWNLYIAKHPDDGRAYLERGGTNYQLGRPDDAGRDARRACDLGFNEACLRAKQLKH